MPPLPPQLVSEAVCDQGVEAFEVKERIEVARCCGIAVDDGRQIGAESVGGDGRGMKESAGADGRGRVPVSPLEKFSVKELRRRRATGGEKSPCRRWQ